MRTFSNPWRYPFCDLFVYKYNQSVDKFIFKREKAKLWWRNNFYDTSLARANGTYLKKFGDFEMRVFVDSEKVLKRHMGTGWEYIGTIHNFNHYTLEERQEVKFLIPHNFTAMNP